ncbi:MAG: hypothetical protein Q9206_004436 [Seirophora lacunosa]
MMTWTGGNNQTICENNLSFQDLVSAQTVFMRGWPMTAALHPASKAAYGLRMINKSVRAKMYYSMTYRSTTPNDDDVSTSSLAQDIAPRVAPIDFESTSFPRSDRTSVSFTRLEGFLKCDALTKIPDPDLQATITCRPVTACVGRSLSHVRPNALTERMCRKTNAFAANLRLRCSEKGSSEHEPDMLQQHSEDGEY